MYFPSYQSKDVKFLLRFFLPFVGVLFLWLIPIDGAQNSTFDGRELVREKIIYAVQVYTAENQFYKYQKSN